MRGSRCAMAISPAELSARARLPAAMAGASRSGAPNRTAADQMISAIDASASKVAPIHGTLSRIFMRLVERSNP